MTVKSVMWQVILHGLVLRSNILCLSSRGGQISFKGLYGLLVILSPILSSKQHFSFLTYNLSIRAGSTTFSFSSICHICFIACTLLVLILSKYWQLGAFTSQIDILNVCIIFSLLQRVNKVTLCCVKTIHSLVGVWWPLRHRSVHIYCISYACCRQVMHVFIPNLNSSSCVTPSFYFLVPSTCVVCMYVMCP